MALKIGQIGLGFMGKMHFDTYARIRGAKVIALCDSDAKKRKGDWSGIAGNIAGKTQPPNLSGVEIYSKFEAMLKNPEIEVVDITLPTYMHEETAIKAMQAGKDVICEKPIARTSREAKNMIVAAKKTGRKLFIGQCIRFWPMYSAAAEIIKSKEYGKVVSAVFRRLSMTPKTPTWSWQNWLLDQKKSGSAAFDMHIHDSDFILFALGKPKSVTSHSASMIKGRMDHIITSYNYSRDTLVVADGGWEYSPGFGFEMSFNIAMEKATLVGAPDCSLTLHPLKGKSKKIKLSKADGYELELRHFVDCIANNKSSKIISPKSAMDSVKLIEAEVKSAQTGKTVMVKL